MCLVNSPLPLKNNNKNTPCFFINLMYVISFTYSLPNSWVKFGISNFAEDKKNRYLRFRFKVTSSMFYCVPRSVPADLSSYHQIHLRHVISSCLWWMVALSSKTLTWEFTPYGLITNIAPTSGDCCDILFSLLNWLCVEVGIIYIYILRTSLQLFKS